MKVDYISDLHLDFYVKHNSDNNKYKINTENFLKNLVPEEIGEVLVIAGDLSHYNKQSYWILKYFSEIYDKVLFVLGNHDYYLISNIQRKRYKNNSKNREFELIQEVFSELNNVTLLFNFEVFEYRGIKFAGSTSWYPLTEFKDYNFFKSVSNDSKLIYDLNISAINQRELEHYDNLIDVDIIITHVPPITINSHIKHGTSSCYLNELKPFKANHYIFGHCHEQSFYEKGDSKFYINALGYPNEWMNNMNPLQYSKEERQEFSKQWNMIKSFEV